MDFWIAMGVAVLVQILESGKISTAHRVKIVRVAAAIENAFADDATFWKDVEERAQRSKLP